jgi:hypothetical protein
MRAPLAALAVVAASALSLAASAPALAAFADPAVGDWIGAATIAGAPQRVTVRVRKAASGGYTGAIARSVSDPAGEPFRTFAADHGLMAFTALGDVRYRGSWDAVNGQWIGALNQNGVRFPMILRRDGRQGVAR